MELLVVMAVLAVAWVVFDRRLRDVREKLEQEAAQRRGSEGLVAELTRRVQALEAVPDARADRVQIPIAAEVAERVERHVEAPAVHAPPPIPVAVQPPQIPVRVCQFCGRISKSGALLCYCGAALDPASGVLESEPSRHAAPLVEAAASSMEATPLEGERSLEAPPPLPQPAFTPPALPTAMHPPAFPESAQPSPMPAPQIVPTESLRDRLRHQVGDEGWEAMVGGSWLNKIGVLVLVIGIALLLGYEFGRVGPAGRIAIGLGVSLTMLVGGVAIERRPAYAIFARGLIGGGWAALYFTAYAMHAVEAARVIENPFLATMLLLAVAAGMILHSLRYHSQTVSGLAYFVAFATLALGESTPFSVIALIPLAASLLGIAYRFDWYKMAVFGLIATYATCASRPDAGAPLESTEALFALYWVLFETFDVMRVRKRLTGFRAESAILPLNALGALTLSIVKWHRVSSGNLWILLAAGAVAYLASAFLRAAIAPPSSFSAALETPERMASGGYEGPVTLASALAAASIFLRAPGMWINAGLLLEGEILFLAGLRFGEAYLRQLAIAVFAASLAKLNYSDLRSPGRFAMAGHKWLLWTPVALATSAVFYLNRFLREAGGALYSSAAAAVITLVLGYETHRPSLCVAWLVFAALLFEFGYRQGKSEFLYQSYVIGALGIAVGLGRNVLYISYFDLLRHEWAPTAMAGAILYAVALRIRFGEESRLRASPLKEAGETVLWFTSASAAAFFAVLMLKLAPAGYLGAGWLVLGAAMFELGLWKLPAQFRTLSYVISGLGFANIAWLHIVLARKGAAPAEAISLAVALLVAYLLTVRVFHQMPGRIDEAEREWVRDVSAGAATLFAMTLAWLELPVALVALAWAIAGLIVLELGFTFLLPRFRFFGNIVAAMVFGRLFFANFSNLGETLEISHRLLTVAPIIVSQYYVWSRYRNAMATDGERSWARLYIWAPAILAVVLMRFELGRSLTVVGWALLTLALYRTGLVRKIADLRWQSYAIALLAFWRSWNTNFYIPESLAGIRARVLTGVIVVACFYCAQLISPRDTESTESAGFRLDPHARTFYSLLASVLLAVLLFYEVSGSMLTMAWGLEAVAVLGAGFPLRDRVQRLSGLVLFLVCVLKLFLYDLRRLETINRILSFIVLGLILVSVSWIYTRFRDRIQRYL